MSSDTDSDFHLSDNDDGGDDDSDGGMPHLQTEESDVDEDNVERDMDSADDSDDDQPPVLLPQVPINLPVLPVPVAPPQGQNLPVAPPVVAIPAYVARDGTIWITGYPQQGKAPARNIVHIIPGPKGPAGQDGMSIVDVFRVLVTDNIVDLVVRHTNTYAHDKVVRLNQARLLRFQTAPTGQQLPRPYAWRDVDAVEMRAFFGLLILAGVERNRRFPIRKMWSTNPLWKRVGFPATIGRDRFKWIMIFIRFDDAVGCRRDKANGIVLHKLRPISELFDMFVGNISYVYEPGFHLTVTEMLFKFKGRCPFRVYMKSKPGRFEIKVWACADAANGYVSNMQIYSGMVNNQRERNQGVRVAKDMVRPFFGSGRGVTTDQGFTSKTLGLDLAAENLTLVGTFNKRRQEIPNEMRVPTGRAVFSSRFCRNNTLNLVSYVPDNRPRKCVILLSTEHSDQAVDLNHAERKPDIILHYNKTKVGVDLADQLVAEYSCHRGTRRWPFTMFCHVLNVAVANASTIYCMKEPAWRRQDRSRRAHFIHALAYDLIWPHLYRRSENLQLATTSRQAMSEVARGLGRALHPANNPPAPAPAQKGRCHVCGTSARKRCSDCGRFVCKQHSRDTKLCNPHC